MVINLSSSQRRKIIYPAKALGYICKGGGTKIHSGPAYPIRQMASLGELTAGIAHEIQNPFNFVNNFSEVNEELLRELKAEADQGNLEEVKAIANDMTLNSEKINHHGKRADTIVKGMLQHSRVSSGQKEPTRY